ncbi:MAG: hypothetical protein GXZ13_06795 [Synergistaceae bacterium]|nr:hypothetical protein [Synergistaceae bacterium]
MRPSNEIERAIKHLNANAAVGDKVGCTQIASLTEKVLADLGSGNYDFSKYDSLVLKQGKKNRRVMLYKLFSTENILCQYIKQILDRRFKVKYPNRNKAIHTLFDFLKAIKQMSEFTVIKYDFKDYFNSVSASYVFEKYILRQMTDHFETDLISAFSSQTKYAYAGLNTSNLFSEIIAIKFDEQIREKFSQHGLLFFERYIDDSIIILNQNLEKAVCDEILNEALLEIYYDKSISVTPQCKTKFNLGKFRIVTRRSLTATSPSSVDFLGYEFFFKKSLKDKTEIQCGITAEKRDKYNGQVDEIIADYKQDSNMELLRHRIAAFSSRIVYMSKKFSSTVWKAKGVINNYGELRFLIDTDLLHDVTKDFLKNMIETAFARNDVSLPYFLIRSTTQRGYNLLKNMKVNKTILLVEHIGYDKLGLEKLCSQIGIAVYGKRYGTLVREYLIKTKVGY